ncbi:MAG: hypothetical protein QOE90_721 [Thermoplasmata archaeon]|nr:hypothetical protein [Thermoplasmata archaeon]
MRPAARGARVRGWPFPWFSVAWLALVSVVVMVKNGAVGILPLDVQHAVGFTPTDFYAHPWAALRSPLALLFNNDAVQYSYVTAIFMLAVPAFEVRHGWKRTAFVFGVGGLASVFLVTLAILLPAWWLLPDNAVVLHSVTRPYMGDSTAVFAIAGALAATLPSRRARWGILAGAVAWESFLFGYFFHFAELISLFHYTALFLGFGLARTAWFTRIPDAEGKRSATGAAGDIEDAEPA